MRTERDPTTLLTNYIRAQFLAAGLWVDRYDPDYLLSVITNWLADHGAVLTEHGVERADHLERR